MKKRVITLSQEHNKVQQSFSSAAIIAQDDKYNTLGVHGKYYSCSDSCGNLTERFKNSIYLHSCGFSSFHNGHRFPSMYPIRPNGVSIQIANWLHF